MLQVSFSCGEFSAEYPRRLGMKVPLCGRGALGYILRFPLSKPGVGQNIALHAAPAGRISYLPGFRLTDLFNFFFFFGQTYVIINSET